MVPVAVLTHMIELLLDLGMNLWTPIKLMKPAQGLE